MSSSSSYELVYFDAPGRAEPIRVMLHAAGMKVKDERFLFKNWEAVKAKAPLGAVPFLKIDATTYCQSMALARYSAKLAGYYPDDPMEALIVDEVMDTCNDLMDSCPRAENDDGDTKKKKRVEWQNTKLVLFANLMEARISGSGGGKFVVNTPTVADLVVHSTVGGIKDGHYDYVDSAFFDKYPGITATCEAIMKEPKVVAYYASIKK